MKTLLLFATTSLFLLAGCSKQEKAPTPEVEVQAEAVAAHEITLHVQGDAVLFALQQAAITPKVSAPVRKFFVQRGARVHRGQLLARLESRDVSAAAEDARGGFQQAESSYKTATQAAVPEEYQKAELDYEQAKTNLDVQQKIFDARQKLFQEGAIPGRDLDTARLNLVQAQSQFNEASKHLESAKAVTREQSMRNAEGQLQSARGKLQVAEASVSYTEIRSPIDGVVTDRPFFDGEMTTPGTPLITVMETSSLLAKAHLPQAEAQQLKPGDDATVTVQGLEKPVPGKVTMVSPALDPGSTTVEVWVKVENKEGALKPGTAARVAIAARTLKDALTIPSSAVLKDDSGKAFVMVVENAMARKRDVQIGITDGDDVQIVEGLKAGEQVITTGSFGLDDKTKVKVVAAEKASDSADDKKSEGKD
ncbi:secretion protein HlyD [Candidatus Koribacter versatilis Ellin345]|uniref:Secretion protein HlyD n=1 Tax=Koribacter versatilis (strain Ellin345) TaxID=204669 RepID=Q1IUY7_KORVE|nr:efflux RND transporter periplasmic adaptor subunit [Candidatus Koribacter versatilis]ABF39313.1 secretion protein HlyD [Candidatus Koribacter versatilis Ellin345]